MSFFANVAYVATGRTTLVAIAVLLLLFGLRQFGWKGALGVCVTGAVMAAAFWASSPYLRQRVLPAVEQIRTHGSGEISTIGLRLELLERSVAFIAEAPVLGQGTGTIPQLFRRGAAAETAPYLRTVNPHNQILAVAIELGLPGAIRSDRNVDRPCRAVSPAYAVSPGAGSSSFQKTSSRRCSTRTCSTSATDGSMSSVSVSWAV